MHLGQPNFLPLLPLALIPFILHLLAQRKRRIVPFSMTRFLEEASMQTQSWRWLRQLLLVLLRTGVIFFALAALLRPFAISSLPLPLAPTSVVLIVDNSLSMQSRSEYEWFFRSKQWCYGLIKGLNAYFTILLASSPAKPVCPFTTDKKTLYRAVSALRPSFQSLDLTGAIQTADTLLNRQKTVAKRIVIITDLQSEPFKSLLFQTLKHPILVVDIKDRPIVGNARLIGKVHLPVDPNESITVVASVQNLSHLPLEGKLSLQIGSKVIATQPVGLQAHKFKQLTFSLLSSTYHLADRHGFVKGKLIWQAQNRSADVLPLDDVMMFAFKSQNKLQVLNAVRIGSTFVETALKSTGIRSVKGISFLDGPDTVVASSQGDLQFVQNFLRWVSRGNGGIIFADEIHSPLWKQFNLSVRRNFITRPLRIGWVNESYPILKGLSSALQTVYVYRSVNLKPNGSNFQILASLSDGTPFLVKLRVGQGFCIIVACGLDEQSSTLPYSPIFVALLHRLVIYSAFKGGIILPKEEEKQPAIDDKFSTVIPKAESDFILPSRKQVQMSLKRHKGFLVSANQSPERILWKTPLRDLSPLCLALVLVCLLVEGILTTIWWHRR